MTAGYSGTPLAKKLGIKPGSAVFVSKAPSNYEALVAPLPDGVTITTKMSAATDIAHLFCKSKAELTAGVEKALPKLKEGGALWISWPKKASGVPTDVTEDVIRQVILPMGLVDIKVCAVDETWSGLKLMRRTRSAPGKAAKKAR
jgi:hypothetical protein